MRLFPVILLSIAPSFCASILGLILAIRRGLRGRPAHGLGLFVNIAVLLFLFFHMLRNQVR